MAQFTIADFAPLYNLTGSWKMNTAKGILFEQWQKSNDSTLYSKSFRVTENNIILLEQVRLQFSKGAIMYTPTVPNQNQGLPVNFTLKKIEKGQYIFENKAHDFPQNIIYKIDKNQLLVTISGETKKSFKEIPYQFTKE